MEDRKISQSKKNLPIEIIRALTLLLILLHHFGGLVHGVNRTHYNLINFCFNLGGEVGVTLFFIISGYGIFHSLESSFTKGNFSYKNFLWRRLQRLAPSYYVALIVMLCIGDGAWYLKKDQILNIISHFFFMHAVVPAYSGAIIGSAWYLGTQFNLYLIAPLLYLVFRNHGAKPCRVALVSIVGGVL